MVIFILLQTRAVECSKMLTSINVLVVTLDLLLFTLMPFVSADENSVFLYNHIENCKSSEYYDVNYFICRECDSHASLTPAKTGKCDNSI